jgi:hypothetical protein
MVRYSLSITRNFGSLLADDILRARLKTLGVSEHRFVMNARESFPLPPPLLIFLFARSEWINEP